MVFVIAGREASQLMHNWIEEGFAYISSKRERGISDLNDERRVRRELQLPEFNGRDWDLDEWILQLEDSFQFFQLNEEVKVKAAIIGLDGKALQEFEREHRWQPFRDWQELKKWLLQYSGLRRPSKKERSEIPPKFFEKMEEIFEKAQRDLKKVIAPRKTKDDGCPAKLDDAIENADDEVEEQVNPRLEDDKGLFVGGVTVGSVENLDGGFRGVESSGRLGDFGDGFAGGGHGGADGEMGGGHHGMTGGVQYNIEESSLGKKLVGVSGDPPAEQFEKGGAGRGGSDGGLGSLAGKGEFGGKATIRSDLNRDGVGFVRGGSAASGSGGPGGSEKGEDNGTTTTIGGLSIKGGILVKGRSGAVAESGPGCLCGCVCGAQEQKATSGLGCRVAGENGGGLQRNVHGRGGVDRGGFAQQRRGDFAGGFTGGGDLIGDGLKSFTGGGVLDGMRPDSYEGGGTEGGKWWTWLLKYSVVACDRSCTLILVKKKIILENGSKGILVKCGEGDRKKWSRCSGLTGPLSCLQCNLLTKHSTCPTSENEGKDSEAVKHVTGPLADKINIQPILPVHVFKPKVQDPRITSQTNPILELGF